MPTDLRYALRSLRRQPGFTGVAVLTLALGIGATSAIFSLVDSYLLRPLPYPHADRLVTVSDDQPSYGEAPASFEEFRDWKTEARTLEAVTAWFGINVNYAGGELPERLGMMLVAEGHFELLGVAPLAGRLFALEEEQDGGPPAVIVSEGFWNTRLGGRPGAIGDVLRLSDKVYTLVGVVPDAPEAGLGVAMVYAPLVPNAPWRDRGTHYLQVLGRLREGQTLESARGELRALGLRLQEARATDHGLVIAPLRDRFVADARGMLLALLGAVGFVLLIATANVANLLLVRSAARGQEFAVRSAIGARRSRLIRLVLTESLLLGVVGAGAGALVGMWSTSLLVGAMPPSIPRPPTVSFDLRVLAFTTAVAVGAALLCGLVPALLELRYAPAESLSGARAAGAGVRARRMRGGLVVSELALSLVLLVGAGLMIHSFKRLLDVDPGFRPDGLLTLSANLPAARYPDAQRRLAFSEAVTARLRQLPGVTGVAVANNLPLVGGMDGDVEIEGRTQDPTDRPNAEKRIVSESYFQVMGIPLRRGRLFGLADRLGGPNVVVVSEVMAERLWPGEEPIGKRIRSLTCGEECWEEVIGVVGDVREEGLDQAAPMEVYYPARQLPLGAMDLLIRATTDDPAALVGPVRRAVADLDRLQPVYNIRTMRDIIAASMAGRRLGAFLLGVFAAVAVVLTAVGIGGVISYAVGQRTREIGLRVALGSEPHAVVRLVVRQGMRLALLGLAIGLPAALGLSRFLRAELYEVAPTQPLAYVAATALLAGVALAACWLPARRAARVDPMEALRHE
jgi:predicted permease